jgi:hypothetical protein
MGWHFVEHEDIPTIALLHGINDWHLIWGHRENAELRRIRSNPLLLANGDRVFVPEDEPDFSAGSGRHVQFRPTPPPFDLRMVSVALHDSRGNPFSGKRFELAYGDEVMEGVTSERGEVNCFVPYNHSAPILTIYPQEENEQLRLTWPFQLGWLEPIDTIVGVKGRLRNLGYRIGALDESAGDDLDSAVRLFRLQHGLPNSTAIDSQLRQRLVRAHGGI